MENYLAHHGILGQKWGHQNGPPYPLKSSQKSYAEKKQNRQETRLDKYKKSEVKRLEKKYNRTYAPLKKAIEISKDNIDWDNHKDVKKAARIANGIQRNYTNTHNLLEKVNSLSVEDMRKERAYEIGSNGLRGGVIGVGASFIEALSGVPMTIPMTMAIVVDVNNSKNRLDEKRLKEIQKQINNQ